MGHPRLRQLVMAAWSLETADLLAEVLGLGAPYIDPGVGVFDLENRVYAIGDQFLEIVVPLKETAPAARFLERNGEGGYMVIFQTRDLASVRQRADDLGIRRVWNSDLKEISASHLHPADIGGAIVSVDEPRPAQSWLWAGPGWEARNVPGALTGAVLTSQEPETVAERWATVLGAPCAGGLIHLQGGSIEFHDGDEDRLSRFMISLPDPAGIIARARERDLDVAGNEISLGGIELIIDPF